MAGGRSPWGGSGNGQDGGEGAPSASDEPGTPAGGGETPPSPPPPPANGPRNPWLPGAGPGGDSNEPPPRRSANIEDIFRNRGKGPQGGGNGGGGGSPFPRLPQRPDGKSWLPLALGGIALVWLGLSCAHTLGSTEQGVVTTFGKYDRLIGPGVSLTLPWPFQSVEVEDVTSIKRDTIPDGEEEKLMLTSDQSLVDISYLVRWNIKDLKLYKFRLEDPDQTVTEVAEAAMRASVAEVPLRDVMGGTGRGRIEQNMRQRMQAILDAYKSGIQIQGVDIKKANPPAKVNAAFQEVSAAQQAAQKDLANAQAWAQQVLAKAQGDAAEFDKVYEQYKLAPDVTRRRMYYETMERVLSANDKVVIEANGVTPYLPLPEVKRRTPETVVEAPAQGGGQ
ncbi:MAG: protease modulator HflK [Sphingomonadales bacterium]|nr:protease modulator HflK [Sphingomonadales bacterium]